MLTIPNDAIEAMKAEIIEQAKRYGYVPLTGLAYRTLDWTWLVAHNLVVAKRVSDQPPYNDEYVLYLPRLERTADENNK